MKYFTLFVCVFFLSSLNSINAQLKPVKWDFSIEKIDDSTAYFVIKADIEDGWNVYGNYPYLKSTEVINERNKDDIPTIRVGKWSYEEKSNCDDNARIPCLEIIYEQGGKLILENLFAMQKCEERYDNVFGMNVYAYRNQLELKQKVELIPNKKLKGYIYFMTCNNEKCMPPTAVDFEIKIQ